MTTSLTKSTIPVYDPHDSYTSPRAAPRVKFEGRENYEKNRGSLNIGDWAIQSKNWESPRPMPKIKYEDAQKAYQRNTEGSMKELLTGYCDNPPIARRGPRITKDAYENFQKNQGTFNHILNDYGKDIKPENFHSRVKFEGKVYNEKNRGSMGNLLGNYGQHPLSARPIPRVKYEGEDNYVNNRGSSIDKTLKMVPASHRPSSTEFFNHKYY